MGRDLWQRVWLKPQRRECEHVCDCRCHKFSGDMRHVAACCAKCEICWAAIKTYEMKSHLSNCHK